MNAHKILFPTDFSTLGQTALEMATSLARDRGAKLLIVHVEEPPMAYGGGELYYGIDEPDRESCSGCWQKSFRPTPRWATSTDSWSVRPPRQSSIWPRRKAWT